MEERSLNGETPEDKDCGNINGLQKSNQEVLSSVSCRRADQLMAEDNDDAIPYCIATGDIKKLVTFFSSRGQLLEALLITQVQRGRGQNVTNR